MRIGLAHAIALVLALHLSCTSLHAEAPYMATGMKIGEVTSSDAIIWVRLTKHEKRTDFGSGLPEVSYTLASTGEALEELSGRQRDAIPHVSFPDGLSIQTIEGAVPGIDGYARIHYSPEGAADKLRTPWQSVNPRADFTTQFRLSNLNPGTAYAIEVEYAASLGAASKTLPGSFRTAPEADTVSPITFTVTTGQRYTDLDSKDGFKIYDVMRALDPDFFVHTGDILYYDELGKTPDLANWHWQRTFSLNSSLRFHNQVASYFIKDDHDTLVNDCWPTMETRYMGDLTFERGVEIFREQVPMGEYTFRTVRWGKDLQVWMVEGRDYRSSNDMVDGPDKTIWGAEQKAWFKRTVAESDATFRILISPTPVVGPDRERKNDNHANEGFTHEGDEIRAFIASQKNMVVICGDRHWQYVSVDATHGVKEYSCGPASDEHAGGWKNDMLRPEHQYLNVIGGFLAVTVTRENDHPVLIARHHGVDGKILNEDSVPAE